MYGRTIHSLLCNQVSVLISEQLMCIHCICSYQWTNWCGREVAAITCRVICSYQCDTQSFINLWHLVPVVGGWDPHLFGIPCVRCHGWMSARDRGQKALQRPKPRLDFQRLCFIVFAYWLGWLSCLYWLLSSAWSFALWNALQLDTIGTFSWTRFGGGTEFQLCCLHTWRRQINFDFHRCILWCALNGQKLP